jgi:hypothetical protein
MAMICTFDYRGAGEEDKNIVCLRYAKLNRACPNSPENRMERLVRLVIVRGKES